MRLYTVCAHNLPVYVTSAGIELPLEDALLTDPDFLKQYRDSETLRKELASKMASMHPGGPAEFHHQVDVREIEEAVDTWLGTHFMTLRLWNGDKSQVSIRQARADEAAKWHSSYQQAIATGRQNAGNEDWAVYLGPVTGRVARREKRRS
jgi:hypothetical protein